ncbi:MAG: hypothetical protein IH838_04340 [Proteobacteria bacterium]|nr:hypothetical protein [Pseudomonadota bacterium]
MQAAVRTTPFEIDFAGIPVDMLFAGRRFEIYCIDAAVTPALLAATHDGRRDEFR